jgi:hypothetical protein
MSDLPPTDSDGASDIRARVAELEARAAADRAELQRLRRLVEPAPKPRPAAVARAPVTRSRAARLGRYLADGVLFVAGAALVTHSIVAELGWPWPIALVAAPIGGLFTAALGRAGATI